jgi:hypothetical protein
MDDLEMISTDDLKPEIIEIKRKAETRKQNAGNNL